MAASIRQLVCARQYYKNLPFVAFLQVSPLRRLHEPIKPITLPAEHLRCGKYKPLQGVFRHNVGQGTKASNFYISTGHVGLSVRTLYHCTSDLNSRNGLMVRTGLPCIFPYRYYSDDAENKPPARVKQVFVGLPNPFTLLRNGVFFFLIRFIFDPEFTQASFIEGAKKALVLVSNEISNGNIDELEGLLTEEAMNEVKERYKKLSVQERQSIALKDEDILYSFPYQLGVNYDTTGSPWIYILMRFWCHSLTAPSDMPSEIKAIRVGKMPEEGTQNFGTVIRCTYEFKRNFAIGVKPDWTISFVQHGSVL
ncbi:m-AAA protease-interacting protein 1, mitochondrial-like [Glandiceps talaboti]